MRLDHRGEAEARRGPLGLLGALAQTAWWGVQPGRGRDLQQLTFLQAALEDVVGRKAVPAQPFDAVPMGLMEQLTILN